MYFPNKRQKRRTVALFLLPSLAGVIVFCLVPILISAAYSLLHYDVLLPLSDASFVGLDNYRRLFQSDELAKALWHTVQYILYYIPVVMVLALAEAMALSRDFRGNSVYRVIYYTPVITSWVAAAVVWKWLLSGKFSPINQAFAAVGVTAPTWLADPNWAMFGISMAAVWKDCGYFALLYLAAIKSIDKTYYEAAEIDGARWFHKFFRITLPLISPTVFLLLVTTLIGSFQVFDSVQVMMTGLPSLATTVMMERIYTYGFKSYQMGTAAAWSWVLFAIILLFTLIQFRLQRRWVNYDV